MCYGTQRRSQHVKMWSDISKGFDSNYRLVTAAALQTLQCLSNCNQDRQAGLDDKIKTPTVKACFDFFLGVLGV